MVPLWSWAEIKEKARVGLDGWICRKTSRRLAHFATRMTTQENSICSSYNIITEQGTSFLGMLT